MLNSLESYQQTVLKHIQASETYAKNFEENLIKNAAFEINTNSEYTVYLQFFLLFKLSFNRKKFYLSAAQKKYRTMVLKTAKLHVKINRKKLDIFYSVLFKSIFGDYIRQTYDGEFVKIQQKSICVVIPDIPLIAYNKSSEFKTLFSATNNLLTVRNTIYFQTYSLPCQLLYLRLSRYIQFIKST